MKSSFFLLILFLPYVFCLPAMLWNRVPKYASNRHITEFVYDQGIHDCFEHVDDENTLRLKCWRDNKLVNVKITIESEVKPKKTWFTSISI